MLRLNAKSQWHNWPAAGIKLKLKPLTRAAKQEIVQATTEFVTDADGTITDVKRDAAEYARLLGLEVIEQWEGVGDQDEAGAFTAAEVNDDTINAFMSIGPAADFVTAKVEGIEAHLAAELTQAGND